MIGAIIIAATAATAGAIAPTEEATALPRPSRWGDLLLWSMLLAPSVTLGVLVWLWVWFLIECLARWPI